MSGHILASPKIRRIICSDGMSLVSRRERGGGEGEGETGTLRALSTQRSALLTVVPSDD